jgi:hypothetical protein
MKRMAEAISIDPRTFRRLGAAQLMKHTLGLSRRYGPRGFRLYYLWYLVPGESAAQHQVEVERFAEVAIREIEFVPMTYQDLFRDLQQLDEPVPGYIEYLADRYFSEAQ